MDGSTRLTRFADTIATVSSPDDTIVPPSLYSSESTHTFANVVDLAGLSTGRSLQLGVVIGEGGMGIVYEAEQTSLGRAVAVKTLGAKRGNQAAALHLLREAWITGMLEHPNIVPVHSLELDDDEVPVIAMKRVEGVAWNAMIRDAMAVRSRFGGSDLLAWNISILIQVINALRFAHNRHVIHRDLKPANVMIGEFGEVYLLDWGIAVSLKDDPRGRLPRHDPNQLAGTPSYMAPEMLSADPPTIATDVYLAGAVLFEIIAGKPPHVGKNVFEVLANSIDNKPQLPSSAPPELVQICERAMHTDPTSRYESAEALQLALRRYLEHRGSAELAASAWARFGQLQAAIEATGANTPHNREDVHRLFGACRFGFHEALAAWPENADAKAGLAAATVAVARYELKDNPQAAVTLLADVEVPPDLVEAARTAVAEHSARQQALERVGAHHDPIIGMRMRALLGLALGGVYTLFPVLSARGVIPKYLQHSEQLRLSSLLLVVSLLGWLMRKRWFRTAINQRLLATCVLLFGSQCLLVSSTWLAGLPSELDQFLLMFHAAVIAWVAVIAIDAWLTPAAIVYTLAFPIVAARYADANYMIAITAFVFTVNVVWLWWPSRPPASGAGT